MVTGGDHCGFCIATYGCGVAAPAMVPGCIRGDGFCLVIDVYKSFMHVSRNYCLELYYFDKHSSIGTPVAFTIDERSIDSHPNQS